LSRFLVSLFVLIGGSVAISKLMSIFHFQNVGLFLCGLWGVFMGPIVSMTWMKDQEKVRD
jgi:hypothetical protein